MKTYIKNIENLNEFLGYETNENTYTKTISFEDVTDLCNGEDEEERFVDFCINAEIGQSFNYKGIDICKVMNANGDAEIVYEDENGEIHSY